MFFEETIALWEVKNIPPLLWNWTVNYRKHTQVTHILFNITLYTALFPRRLFYFGFSKKVLWVLFISFVLETCLSHTIFFSFIAMIFGAQKSL
jgi:hypothetical protein